MAKKYVYMFEEGNAAMRNLLGGKGANLAEMASINLPVPPGFTVTTDACMEYSKTGTLSEEITQQVETALAKLEEKIGKKLGDIENPLLVSVRSGARASMPGMMDTVLNLGLNDKAVVGLAKKSNNERFAYDSYRRFIMMFADVVIGVPKSHFEQYLDEYKAEKGVKYDVDLDAEDFKKIASKFKKIYNEKHGSPFPQDAKEQLYAAIMAVFRSWDNPRANFYRQMNDIPYDWGTAVNVQSMVFGNTGSKSGTAVLFSRNPKTGEKVLFGEYLIDAQGEDVVAGVRTPSDINHLAKEADPDLAALYTDIVKVANTLETHYKDMQDMEVTFEDGKLYMLQTRIGKRTGIAAVKIAVDLVREGLATKEEALLSVDPKQLDQLLHPVFVKYALEKADPVGKGLPASPGAAAGKVVFTAEDAKERAEKGERVVLVRLETSPEDIEGMAAAQGILTVRGGMTSHAAVVARGMGTCCVSGCEDIKISAEDKFFELGGEHFTEDSYISLDGNTGFIYAADIPTTEPEINKDFEEFMSWADAIRKLQVRTNSDTPRDAKKALEFGAEGIGLVRTEHMFFNEDRIPKMRCFVLSDSEEERKEAIKALEEYQAKDFREIYKVMKNLPVTVRLLDPPLHEFLPTTDAEFDAVSKLMNIPTEKLKVKAHNLHELNPMMGHRGCRLAVSYPELPEMQTKAIIEAAIDVKESYGYDIKPEIMIPLIGDVKELNFVVNIVKATADKIIAESGTEIEYKVGTMIEIPRAALLADEIAEVAEFFSFGTNDLTQLTYGLSRDDAGTILKNYKDKHIYEADPTARLDTHGVGKLVNIAIKGGKATRPNIKLGICGEHGGDPSSIEFFHKSGLNYVSCSPFRVPIARLAAAQAQIKYPR